LIYNIPSLLFQIHYLIILQIRYLSEEDGSVPAVSIYDKDGSNLIFQIYKSMNIIKVGGCQKWVGAVRVGEKNLELYGE
jgi:hypothetical protein